MVKPMIFIPESLEILGSVLSTIESKAELNGAMIKKLNALVRYLSEIL